MAGRSGRRRLDLELVRRRLAPSREQAREAIDAGRVLVSGTVADKAARLVAAGEPIVLRGDPPRYVGRGGHKLEAALARFGVEVGGRRALDAGASTGGFTDCLLQRGAAEVTAVDVGHGQLDARLRADARVVVRERTNVREMGPADLPGGAVALTVADLSFISLRTVAPNLVAVTEGGGDLVVLVKPQFEAGRAVVGRGRGVVTDPEVWAEVLASVIDAFGRTGAVIMGLMTSPLLGADGNVEFLAHFRAPTGHGPGGGEAAAGAGGGEPQPGAVDELVRAAVAEAVALRAARGVAG